ncbi:MAG: zinc-dependent metalloprotease [Intrasporangiaceae bacterium]|nr:zinc-dependent metalloprotease [Intrasporangiaceae bacterium]
MSDEITPRNPDDSDPEDRDPSGQSGLPPELEKMFESLTGGPVPPEMAGLMSSFGIDKMDPGVIQQAMDQVQSMMQSGGPGALLGDLLGGAGSPGGAVDQTAALTAAKAVVTGAGAAGRTLEEVEDSAARAVSEAVRIASLWVDEATSLPAHTAWAHAWTPLNWTEETMPLWSELVDPVAKGLAHAMSQASAGQLGRLTDGDAPLPPELAGMLPPGMDVSAVMGQVQGMLERMSAGMFSTQLGQAIGTLSQEVLTGSDVGLPLVPDDHIVLLPDAIRDLAAGLSIDEAEVRLYLAVREVARTRLFAQVPWLGPQVLAAVRDYAADITFDLDGIESQLQGVDLQNPEALQSALSGSLFAPTPSEAQTRALDRLEASLALIEGWVDVVAEDATSRTLPSSGALAEAIRRRRASGGPGEKVFRGLVGLDLRPRRLRDAANLFRAMADKHGRFARDDVWQHPDMAPQSADLDDPLGYVERFGTTTSDEMDDELARLLDGARSEDDGRSGDENNGDENNGDETRGA